MSLTRPSLLGTVFFRTALPCSGCYHMERGGMPLHDAVGINCKKGATTENQGSAVKYMGKGCILMTVCVCFICPDMTTPPWCREKVMAYYYNKTWLLRWADDLSIFNYPSPFCCLLIEFHCAFSLSCIIIPY